MGTSGSTALVTVRRRPFQCLVCGGREFTSRDIKLNTAGFEFFDLAWLNKSALGVICTGCGYVHEFLGDAVEFWDAAGGYPG